MPFPIDAYLKEIGLAKSELKMDLESLSKIYQQQIEHIPYQNFELRRESYKPIEQRQVSSLKSDDLLQQMLEKHQGGYCYQLVDLMYLALQALGFSVKRYAATVILDTKVGDKLKLPPTHGLLSVTIANKEYLLDPGFSPKIFREPILLDGQTSKLIKQGTQNYKLMFHNQRYTLCEAQDNEWFMYYQFNISKPLDDKQQNELNTILFKDQGPFNIRDTYTLLGRVTPKMRLSILATEQRVEFCIDEGVNVRKKLVTSKDHFDHIAKKHFGLTVPGNYKYPGCLSGHSVSLFQGNKTTINRLEVVPKSFVTSRNK